MKIFFTLSLTSFVFSSALWIIWYFFVVQIEGNPNWLGSLFYLPHAARVLCIVYFGWRAIPALFLAELWGPQFSILDIESLINLIPGLLSVLSVPLSLQTLHWFDFPLGNTAGSPLNKSNFKHIALITMISAIYNSLLVNLVLTKFSMSSSVIGIDQIVRFFIGDMLGTIIVLVFLVFSLRPLLNSKKVN
ncbi:hypothetical protein OAE17_01270 [Gammaproteobacteria bacterium]|nr:hypothetical protein [Gammaproteobacteria bacterium]